MKKALIKPILGLSLVTFLSPAFAIKPNPKCYKMQKDLLGYLGFPKEVSAILPFSIDLALAEKSQSHKQVWSSQRAHREAIIEILRERLENINTKSKSAYWTLVDPLSYKNSHWSGNPRSEIESFFTGRWVALAEQNFRIKDPRIESPEVVANKIHVLDEATTRGLAGRVLKVEFVEGPTLNSPLENILLTIQLPQTASQKLTHTVISLRDISELHFLTFKPRQQVMSFMIDPAIQMALKEIDLGTQSLKISTFSPATADQARKEVRETWQHLIKNAFRPEQGWIKIEASATKAPLGQFVTQFDWPKNQIETLVGKVVSGIQTQSKAEQDILAQYNVEHFKNIGARLGAQIEGRKALTLKRTFGADEYIHEIFMGKVIAAVDSEDGQSLLLLDTPFGEKLISVPGPQSIWYHAGQ